MRRIALAALLSIAHIAVAADYPLTAKVKNVTTQSTRGRFTNVDSDTVNLRMVSRVTTVQVGSTLYTSTDACNLAVAGQEYSARLDVKRKLLGPRFYELHMRVAGKDCRLTVTGSEEGR